MTRQTIIKAFPTAETLINSKEYSKVFEGWQGKESRARIIQDSDFRFGFTIKADPEKNYGDDFELYYVVKAEDGPFLMNRIQTFSSMDSYDFQQVIVSFEREEVIWLDQHFGRSAKHRAAIAALDIIVTTNRK